jgi:hypothetical protein
MVSSLARKLVLYRTSIVAIANAAITWIVLIIAPLGLFAVITCTGLVFLSSLIVGLWSDRALIRLLQSNDQIAIQTMQQGNFSKDSQESIQLPIQEQRQLPK